jgi:glycosyltransferase involved in cell wall biosynthesis
MARPFKKRRVGIIKSTPDQFKNNVSDYRVGFTMIENTKIGKSWVDMCNEMDHIFVPNALNLQSFKECGVTVPISLVRQGFNPNQYKFFQRDVNKPVFTFTLAGYLDSRKNWDDVVRAFSSEFSSDEPVELLLKNSCPSFGYNIPNDPRIKIIEKTFSNEEMTKLYQITDCFMFTTRGEGSGLPAREAMATGAPCILTDYQGLAEVCDPKFNYPIAPISIDYPDNRPEQPGFMARLDVAEIMYWMRHVYENKADAFAKGKLASEEMHRHWKWSDCASDMLDIIKTL